MRVAYLSHSLVAERQALFAQELRRQLEANGGALLEVYPNRWGRHEREGGYVVSNAGDMLAFNWPPEAYRAVLGFKPDVVLIQNEAYCASAIHTSAWCHGKGLKYVTFSWENNPYPRMAEKAVSNVLNHAAANVYGNTAARLLGEALGGANHVQVLPQVGIDQNLFKPHPDVQKDIDVLFMGRKADPMKGWSVLEEASKGEAWKPVAGSDMGFVEYKDLPRQRYCRARVLCVPSRDVEGLPREQFAPAVAVEAMMCGTPVVHSDQEAISEWMKGIPTWRVPQNDSASLRTLIYTAITADDTYLAPALRADAMERFSNETVCAQYISLFRKVL